MKALREFIVSLLLGLVATPLCAADWNLTPTQRAALARGDVLVEAVMDRTATGGNLRAAVQIGAPAARVYAVMMDCEAALRFVPHLQSCKVLERSADGRSAVIEHVSDLGWYAPRTRYAFRAEYDPPHSVDFRHVSGDFSENEGRWELIPIDQGRATIVTYRVRVVPKIAVPRWLVRATLKRELPDLLRSLRRFSEAP